MSGGGGAGCETKVSDSIGKTRTFKEPLAQWLERRTADQEVRGSSPAFYITPLLTDLPSLRTGFDDTAVVAQHAPEPRGHDSAGLAVTPRPRRLVAAAAAGPLRPTSFPQTAAVAHHLHDRDLPLQTAVAVAGAPVTAYNAPRTADAALEMRDAHNALLRARGALQAPPLQGGHEQTVVAAVGAEARLRAPAATARGLPSEAPAAAAGGGEEAEDADVTAAGARVAGRAGAAFFVAADCRRRGHGDPQPVRQKHRYFLPQEISDVIFLQLTCHMLHYKTLRDLTHQLGGETAAQRACSSLCAARSAP